MFNEMHWQWYTFLKKLFFCNPAKIWNSEEVHKSEKVSSLMLNWHSVNSFKSNVPFLLAPGNLWFSDAFRGKKRNTELKWVNGILYKLSNAELFNNFFSEKGIICKDKGSYFAMEMYILDITGKRKFSITWDFGHKNYTRGRLIFSHYHALWR